ncbi:MAG TPA: FAD:protein FMN transferase [Solirubrobacterales bacterium]|nr:FAD:protein FMN transferase [Solirubrobacterales bacterium]
MSGEEKRSFACFGGTVTVHLGGAGASAEKAISRAEAELLDAHERLSRFLPDSELSRFNRDPRTTVPVSALMLELAAAVRRAGALSAGLVDATLLAEIERAGYDESRTPVHEQTGPRAPEAAPGERRRAPAAASRSRGWNQIAVNRKTVSVSRPPGLGIDSGGIAKGLLADIVAATLRHHSTYAVDCCGDIRVGGAAGRPRAVLVEDPSGGEPLRSLSIRDGAVATSGIAKRSWVGSDGGPAHHLLDPSTGAPAFTGVVQATAQAPSAFLAEVYSKQALLSGPDRGLDCLRFGGVLVLDDGSVEFVEAERMRPRSVVP